MFDLELAISNWKHDLAARAGSTVEDVAELEEHLRLTIEQQRGRGRTAEEAFAWATYRIGNVESLAAEYDKVAPLPRWRLPILWMLGGYVGGIVVTNAIGAVSSLCVAALARLGWSGTALGLTAVLIAAACWTGLFYLLWRYAHSHTANQPAIASGVYLWALAVLALVGYLFEILGRGAFVRLANSERVGEYTYTLALGNLLLFSAVFLTVLIFMRLFRQNAADTDEPLALR